MITKRYSDEDINQLIAQQRRELSKMHDETLAELERVRAVAKEEIDSLQAQVAAAQTHRDGYKRLLERVEILVMQLNDKNDALQAQLAEAQTEIERLREIEESWNEAIETGLIIR
jgi:chromosome segregation ATPase